MTAETLDEAIELQNRVEYGLTAGLHSLDADDIDVWLKNVQAGNVYVNRGITGAIVRRQPFGGWKKSAVGPGAKAGGPNYLVALGDWTTAEASAQDSPADEVIGFVQEAAKVAGLDDAARERLTRATHSDAAMLRSEFGVRKDVSGLTAERNVFRYLPCPAVIRLTAGGEVADLVRVVAAALAVGAPVTVSLPDRRYAPLVEGSGLELEVLTDDAWLRSLASGPARRVRLIGGSASAVYPAVDGRPDIAVYDHEVTEAGRIELLPFLHEQAISITAHRFGTPNHLTDAII